MCDDPSDNIEIRAVCMAEKSKENGNVRFIKLSIPSDLPVWALCGHNVDVWIQLSSFDLHSDWVRDRAASCELGTSCTTPCSLSLFAFGSLKDGHRIASVAVPQSRNISLERRNCKDSILIWGGLFKRDSYV